MTMTSSFVSHKMGEKRLIFHSVKYDSDPFWYDPDVESKAVVRKFLKVKDEKLMSESRQRNAFSQFSVENLRFACV
jgi:hypothetical protein